MQAGILP